jgi:hypothetical protein
MVLIGSYPHILRLTEALPEPGKLLCSTRDAAAAPGRAPVQPGATSIVDESPMEVEMLKRANRKTDTFFPHQFLMELHIREEGTAQQQPQALEYTEGFFFRFSEASGTFRP